MNAAVEVYVIRRLGVCGGENAIGFRDIDVIILTSRKNSMALLLDRSFTEGPINEAECQRSKD